MIGISWSAPDEVEQQQREQPVVYRARARFDTHTNESTSVYFPAHWSAWRRLSWRFRHWQWS